MQRKKIAIFQADLNVGGIQRSLVNLLKSGILDPYDVDVYLFSREIFYDISSFGQNIQIIFLRPFPYWFRFLPFRMIRKGSFYAEARDEYDFVFDFDSYRQECAYCALKMKRARKILWIHYDMEKELRYNRKYRILYLFFRGKFKYYDAFAAVSEGVVKPFQKYSGQRKICVTVIPNVIDTEEILKQSLEETDVSVDPEACNIACVGRIYVQKGYDLLLKDFYAAYQKRRDLRCYIIGDGPDAGRYRKQAARRGLSDAVFFLGNRKNPFPILKKMDAFCLESRSEGQGMVLLEAKCLGLQLIFPKRLEKYNDGLKGVDNVEEALVHLKKEEKREDRLRQYHLRITEQYKKLLRDI